MKAAPCFGLGSPFDDKRFPLSGKTEGMDFIVCKTIPFLIQKIVWHKIGVCVGLSRYLPKEGSILLRRCYVFCAMETGESLVSKAMRAAARMHHRT